MILRPLSQVAGFTLTSRVLGFLRDILIAGYLGAGPLADAFFIAFKLPNMMRRLFAEGAFHAAFVPLFASKLAQGGPARARDFAEQALALMLTGGFFLLLLAEIAMPEIVALIAPGFRAATRDTTVELASVTFAYLTFMGLAALMGGVLNGTHRFAAAAAAPILLNLVLILALFALTPLLPSAAHALAWGVALAGAGQFLWLAFALARADFALRLRRPRLGSEARGLLRRMLPGAIGVGVLQINLLVDSVLASLIGPGAVSFLYYADRVNQLPLGVVGAAIGIVLLPTLTRQLSLGRDSAAHTTQNRALALALFFALPAAAALWLLAEPLMIALFRRGAFDLHVAQASAQALAAFATGLPAFIAGKVLAPAFFARGDTRTPVIIAIVAMAANILLALILMPVLAQGGIALATSLAGWLGLALSLRVLVRRGQFRPDRELLMRSVRILGAAIGMSLSLYVLVLLVGADNAGRPLRFFAIVAFGASLYAVLAWSLGAVRREDLERAFRPAAIDS